MQRYLKWITRLSLGLMLSACGKDVAKSVQQQVADPKLMKTWEGGCSSSDLLDLSKKTYFDFSGAAYKEVHTFYAEKNCLGDAAEVAYTGELTLRDKAPNGTRPLDFRFDKVEAKVLGPRGKDVLEKMKFCGLSAWEMGKAVDLTGKTGTVGCPLRKVPTGEYNLSSVENDVLYLGKVGLRGGASVEADRPKEVDHKAPFRPSERKL